MSNIFTERDENELVQQRNVKPVRGTPKPLGQPSPPKQEEPAQPEVAAQEPENEPDTASQPESPVAPQQQQPPGLYQAPIPFAPPIGYEPVQSSPFAFQSQYQLLDSLQQGAGSNAESLQPLLEQNVTVNPATESISQMQGDPLTQSQEWTDEWTGSVKASWDKYVTHTNVGINPATQFDATGKPIKQATEQEIKTGLNGLMSDLGQSLKNDFDPGNWFSGSLRTMKGLVPMVVESLPGAVQSLPFVEDVADLTAQLFSGDEAFIEENRRQMEARRNLFYANVRGDMNAADESRKILQNNPLAHSYNDFGDGALGMVFRTLSLPENLMMATAYEYADGWRQFMDNRDKRGFLGNMQAGLAATAGSLSAIEPELDKTENRYIKVLQGRDLSAFNRWSEERYLTLQEPTGVSAGDITGNWWWDLPENIMNNIVPSYGDVEHSSFGQHMTLSMMHNVLQGVPSFAVSIVSDAPFDMVVDALWKAGSKLDAVKTFTRKADDAPLMEVRPFKVEELPPANQLALPASDMSAASYITIDVPATVVDDVVTVDTPFRAGQVSDPWNEFEVIADPWDVTPNPNKAQTHMVTIDSEVPQLIPTVDLDFVYRSNEDLARLANRMGISVEPTDAQINALIREDPDRFARYGKPVHPEIENFNTVVTDSGSVRITPVAPLETKPLPDLTITEQLDTFNNAGNKMTAAQVEMEDALRNGTVPPDSAIVKYQEAQTSLVTTRDELPPVVAYKENVHKLPPALHTTAAPQTEVPGATYITALQDAETANIGAKQLLNNYEELDGVDQLIDTKLKALPNVGYEDMHDIQATMGHYGLDDMMDAPIAHDVPEPGDLIKTLADDPVLASLEKQVKEQADSWSKESAALEKKLVKEYKKQGLDPLDYESDPLFTVPQAESLFRRQELVYKQLKREAEITGSINEMSAKSFLSDKDLLFKEHAPLLPKAKQDSLKFMYDDIEQATKKPQAVPQQQVINQQIQTTDKAGDLKMSGEGNLDDAWQQGQAEFEQMFDELDTSPPANPMVNFMTDAQKAVPDEVVQKHHQITDMGKQFPDEVDPSLEVFEPGEAVQSYTMGTTTANKLGWDAALHRDLINMGEAEFENLHRQVPVDIAEDYWRWYKNGHLQPGMELPHHRVMSFTDMDAPGASPYGGGYYEGVEIWGTKVQGTPVDAVSFFPGENEVIVKKWTKLEVTKTEVIGKPGDQALRIYVTRKFDAPVKTPDEYVIGQLQRGGDLVWMHGTNVDDDIRRFIPENGSGTHELGMGLYLTVDDRVAEAAAKKYRYENVPVNINYQVGTPHISEVDLTNIRQVINLDDMITKKRFMELFGEALDNVHEPVDVQDFYKYWRDNTDQTVGSVFDSYREWLASLNGGVDELLNRTFQKDVLNRFRRDYDAGIKGGTMVVYNPERLINSGYRQVSPSGADPVLEALESRRFLDEVAEKQMGTDTRRVVRLQSQGDEVEYQKQKVSEAYAQEAAKQADATKRLTEADEELRRTVRDAEDAKTERTQRRIEDGKAEDPMPSDADGVQRLMERDQDFRKFRGKLEQKLQKKIDRLSKMSPSADNKAKRRLMQEIKDLTEQIDSVDSAVNHYERVFQAVNPERVKPDWKDPLRTILHTVDGHIIDRNWWRNRSQYAWSKSFQKAKEGIEHFVARYISNYIGDVGKVQRELNNLKRVGRGRFQMLLAKREAAKRVSEVEKSVRRMLKSYNLSEEDFARLFHDVAELQTSPYLVDAMENANVNIYHYLSNKLNTEYARYIDMGIPEDVMEQVAKKVQEIPQVYAEVKSLADEMGINFGDEVTLGYIPRQVKRTTEFWLQRGHKGEQVGADFMKSRAAFHWIPEDSQVVDVVMNELHPGWKQAASEALGYDVKHFDDLIGDDGAMLATVFGIMDSNTLDMMNNMGIMRKVPFTASESAKFLADKYQLPFKGLTDIYVADPKRAVEMYSKGLADKAAKNMTTFGLNEAAAFTKHIDEMDNAAKEVFTVPFMDALPDALKNSLPDGFKEAMSGRYVHELVARELKAMYHVSTSAGLLAQVGDVLNVVYKAGSSMMLLSGRWFAYQELGNAANLIKRNMNPGEFFSFQAKRIRSLANNGVMDFDDTKRIYFGGTMTQKEVYDYAVESGLIESGETFLGSAAKRPVVPLKDTPAEMKRAAAEFFQFLTQSGAHGNVDRSAGQYLTGLSERILSGVDTTIDHTTMRYVDFGNRLTDDAFKFALFEAVLRDPGTRLAIPGWKAMGGIPNFTQIEAAVKYVRDNSFMFDEATGGAEGAMRYLVPFWSFHRLNLGETARWVASNPAKFASYLRLVNSLQSGFNEDDSAAWEALHSNKWFDNQFTVPFRIPGEHSQSGGDEIWTLPTAQLFPSFGALATTADVIELFSGGNIRIPFDVGEGESKPSQSKYNQFSQGKDLKAVVQQQGSPFLKQLLSVLDEDYLFDYDLSQGYDLDESYPLGMNKKEWATLRLWLPPFAKLVNSLPTSIMGRAPAFNRQTGEYTEGVKSQFTGQFPRFTSANVPNYFGKGVFGDFMKNMGLQPMPFDMFISQEYTMSNISYQVNQAESMMYRIRKELAETAPGDTEKVERLTQRAQEVSLLAVHLRSEYEIYRQWRKLNNIPHPKAVKRIINENLKVSDLLPKAERERIYKENYDKYMGYFTY